MTGTSGFCLQKDRSHHAARVDFPQPLSPDTSKIDFSESFWLRSLKAHKNLTHNIKYVNQTLYLGFYVLTMWNELLDFSSASQILHYGLQDALICLVRSVLLWWVPRAQTSHTVYVHASHGIAHRMNPAILQQIKSKIINVSYLNPHILFLGLRNPKAKITTHQNHTYHWSVRLTIISDNN